MELAIQFVAIATAVVGLATAIVKAVSTTWGKRPKTQRDRRR